MILFLKVDGAGEMFDKICLKARYIFSQCVFPIKGQTRRVSVKENGALDILVSGHLTEGWEF